MLGMRKRVVITGMGMVNPMGHDVETVWAGLKACRSGVGYTTVFDASSFPSRISAEVKNWDVSLAGEDPEKWKSCGRHTKFAVGAAKQAVGASGVLASGIDPRRLGVYLGSGEGNQDFLEFSQMVIAALDGPNLDLSRFIKSGLETLSPWNHWTSPN